MKKLLTLIVSSLGLMASAAINPADFTDLEFDTEYQLKQYKSFQGKITAHESGVIIEYGNIPANILTSAGELKIVPGWTYAGFINGKQAYQFEAKAGTTYYIYSDFVMDDGVISFAMNPEVKILGIYPADGSVYDIASSEYVDVTANQNITIGKATVSVGDVSAEVEIRTYSSVSSILINGTLSTWYENGTIEGGETIKILLSEIQDNMGKQAKDIVINYTAAAKPYTLVGTEIPSPIFSWYPSGSEEAKAKFIFNGPVAPNPLVELGYSPIELGYEYSEILPATVDGDTIIVDLSGKLRTPELMSPSGMIYDFIDIRLTGIKDIRGQFMLASEGSIGSYHIRTPFQSLERINFAAEFTPAYGSDLTGQSEIKIAYNHPDQLDFSGVVFTSGEEMVTVPKSELTVSDGLITVMIPEGWSVKSNVFVSLFGLVTADGIDHSSEFTAKYNGFAVLFSNPADGASLSVLTKGRTVTIDTNLNSGEAVTFSLVGDDQVIYGPVTMTEKYEGQYIHVMESNVILYAAETYTMLFSARGTEETIDIHGQSVPFEYSDIELKSISHEQGAALKGGDAISIEFTGMVFVEKLEESIDFIAEGNGGDSENIGGYDYIWTLTLPNDLTADFSVRFTAIDETGKPVKGNSGNDESTCFVLNYKSTSGLLELKNPTADTSVIFDLKGRRILTPGRGINIVNGKKVIR